MGHGYDIKTSVDYFKKLMDEREDFLKNQSSARHGINYAITGWQLHDWVFAEKHKYPFLLQFAKKKDFQKYLHDNWVGFRNLQDLADGAKHYELTYRQTNITQTMLASWDELFGDKNVMKDSDPQLFLTFKISGLETITLLLVLMEGVTRFWYRLFQDKLAEQISLDGYTAFLWDKKSNAR